MSYWISLQARDLLDFGKGSKWICKVLRQSLWRAYLVACSCLTLASFGFHVFWLIYYAFLLHSMLRVDDCCSSVISAHGLWCWRKWTDWSNKKFFYNKNVSRMSGSRTDFLLGYLKVSTPLTKFTTPHASVPEKEQEVTWGDHAHFCCRSQDCCQLHVLCGDKGISCTGPGRLKQDQTCLEYSLTAL